MADWWKRPCAEPKRDDYDRDEEYQRKHSGWQAENKLWKTARNLENDWKVSMNSSFQWSSSSGEGDAFLYHNQHGLFIIEVKSGQIRAQGGTWWQNDRDMEKKNPIDQVEKLAANVRKELRSTAPGMPRIRTITMVCFPDMDDRRNIANEMAPSSMMILNGDLSTPAMLKRKLERRARELSTYSHSNLDPDNIAKLRKFLRGESEVPAKEIWEAQRCARWDVQDYMRVFVDAIHSNKNLVVEGVAGSGKTKMAEWEMDLFLKDNKKVAYACYNVLLARHIEQRRSGEPAGRPLVIREFLGWADWLVEKIEYKRNKLDKCHEEIETCEETMEQNEDNNRDAYKSARQKRRECYKNIENLMGEIVGSLKEKHKFDALFIDEGQDFSETQINILLGLLKQDAYLRIFQDKTQDIFRKQTSDEGIPPTGNKPWEKLLKNVTAVELNHSYRSTKVILDWVRKETGMDIKSYDEMPNGDEVETVCYSDDSDLVQQISDKMKKLQNGPSIPPGDIMIVSLAYQDAFKDRLKRVKAETGLEISNCLLFPKERFTDKNKAELHSIFRVKGLERNCVFLLDNDDRLRQDEPRYKRLLATAATRARSHLIVFRKTGASG